MSSAASISELTCAVRRIADAMDHQNKAVGEISKLLVPTLQEAERLRARSAAIRDQADAARRGLVHFLLSEASEFTLRQAEERFGENTLRDLRWEVEPDEFEDDDGLPQ